MNIDRVAADASKAMAYEVLRHVENAIKALRSDASAIDQKHVEGYEAGFRAAKRAALEAIAIKV